MKNEIIVENDVCKIIALFFDWKRLDIKYSIVKIDIWSDWFKLNYWHYWMYFHDQWQF